MANRDYARLKNNPGIWRVDGIGPINPNVRLAARTNVLFSGLAENFKDPYLKESLNNTNLSFPISTASIFNFKIGSVWKDGTQILSPDARLKSIEVDTSRARLIALGKSVKLREDLWANSVVPENKFVLGENRDRLNSSLYALVPTINSDFHKWVVIPASEIFRFYYGVSTRLSSSILLGQTNKYVDWRKSRSEGDTVVLHLKQSLHRLERCVFARAIATNDAAKAFNAIRQHLITIHANNKSKPNNPDPLAIRANFPFKGITTLNVIGKPFAYSNKFSNEVKRIIGDEWFFFAMEITKCTHSFGFSKLIIESDEEFLTTRSGPQKPGDTYPRPNPRSPDDFDEDDIADDDPADARLKRLAILADSNQFSALADIKISRAKTASEINGNGTTRNPIGTDIKGYSLEEGTYGKEGKDIQGVDTALQPTPHIARDISLFLDVLPHLRQATNKYSWKITTRKGKYGLTKNEELIALFPRRIANCKTWHKIVDAITNETRTRQVVWAEFFLPEQQRFFYLLEMELKPNENGQCTILFYKNDFSHCNIDIFEDLLILTAIQNRWPSKNNKWKKEGHEILAKKFFNSNVMHRITHPHQINKKNNEGFEVSYTSQWSDQLLEKIKSNIFSNRI